LKIKVDEAGSLDQRFKSLQQEYENFRSGQARGLAQENEELKRKLAEFERRIAMLSEEIERLNNNLRVKVEENSKFELRNRQLEQELENLRRKGSEIENTVMY